MCNYRILAHTEDGYIIMCHSCGHYQLAFGTTAVTLDEGRFRKLCAKVSLLKEETECNGFEMQKRIHIEILCSCVVMLLNYKELGRLNDLLGEAAFNEEVENLIDHSRLTRE